MFYDVHIPRCTHIKTNGTQCGQAFFWLECCISNMEHGRWTGDTFHVL